MTKMELATPAVMNGTDVFRMRREIIQEALAVGDEIEFSKDAWRKRYKVDRFDGDDYVFVESLRIGP